MPASVTIIATRAISRIARRATSSLARAFHLSLRARFFQAVKNSSQPEPSCFSFSPNSIAITREIPLVFRMINRKTLHHQYKPAVPGQSMIRSDPDNLEQPPGSKF
ncbi:MAG: hypothetical protein K6U04_08195 [Armatimonadetes bacterium]|nr:hypothetical protein [Armatimonadota bacterium]